jgi:hypothetical protein
VTDEPSEAAAWAAASKDKTAEAFEKFALAYPGSAHAAEAQQQTGEMRAAAADAAAWAAAIKDNSATEFDQFATVFPNSAHQQEALRKRDELRAAALAAQEKLDWGNDAVAKDEDKATAARPMARTSSAEVLAPRRSAHMVCATVLGEFPVLPYRLAGGPCVAVGTRYGSLSGVVVKPRRPAQSGPLIMVIPN